MSESVVGQIIDAAEYTGGFLGDFVRTALAILVFVVVILALNWLGGTFRRTLVSRVQARVRPQGDSSTLIDNLLRVGFLLIGLVLALGVLGVGAESMVTWIGVIVAALSIALQDVIKNLVAGFYLLIEQPFRSGDRLVLQDQEGRVERVDLRVTAIRNRNRQLVLVPNYLVFSQVVINKTAMEPNCLVLRIANLAVAPVMIDSAIQTVVRGVLGNDGKPALVLLNDIDGQSVSVTARIWMNDDNVLRERMIIELHDAWPSATIAVLEG